MLHTSSFPKKLYDKLRLHGVTKVYLQFTGGYDEGNLYIELTYEEDRETCPQLEKDVEEWAWDVNSYSGAGDGSGEYGDDVTFDLINNTSEASEWHMARVDGDSEEFTFDVEEGE
jgi:hypothetical protein